MRLSSGTVWPGLAAFLAVEEHLAGHDEGLGFFAGFSEAACQDEPVETGFHNLVGQTIAFLSSANWFADHKKRWSAPLCKQISALAS